MNDNSMDVQSFASYTQTNQPVEDKKEQFNTQADATSKETGEIGSKTLNTLNKKVFIIKRRISSDQFSGPTVQRYGFSQEQTQVMVSQSHDTPQKTIWKNAIPKQLSERKEVQETQLPKKRLGKTQPEEFRRTDRTEVKENVEILDLPVKNFKTKDSLSQKIIKKHSDLKQRRINKIRESKQKKIVKLEQQLNNLNVQYIKKNEEILDYIQDKNYSKNYVNILKRDHNEISEKMIHLDKKIERLKKNNQFK